MSTENTENRDYKYVMQDFTTVYLGARYTYEELIEAEDIPFKIKTLVNHYIKPELAGGESVSGKPFLLYGRKRVCLSDFSATED